MFIDQFGDDPEIKILLDMASNVEKDTLEKTKNTFRDFNIRCRYSYFLFSKKNILRLLCKKICLDNENIFNKFILTLIIMGSIKLGVDTYIDEALGLGKLWAVTAKSYSNIIEQGLTWLFFVEFLIKSITRGFLLDSGSYLRDNWCRLDFAIVIVLILDLITVILGAEGKF